MQEKYIQCIQNANKNNSPEQTIYAIKNAGFDGTFVQWYDEDLEFDQQKQVDLCRSLGLEIEFAHLGYQGINDIWLEGEAGDKLVARYKKNLDDCKKNGISLVILHLQSKHIAPEPNEIGLERFKQIVKHAEELSIRIAFENTKLRGYLDYIFDNIQSDYIGICLDVGHFHCHFKDQINWERLKNKIFAVHLHDNDSTSDQHLLPFDGTVNWEPFIKNLHEANYNGPITLESCYRNDYLNITVEEFYQKAYSKAKEIHKIDVEINA